MRFFPLLTLAIFPAVALAQGFAPGCPLPFAAIARTHPVDADCGMEGNLTAKEGAPRRLQNAAQNNFCVSGEPAAITRADFIALHQAILAKDILWGCASCLPKDRSLLLDMLPSKDGASLGEGRMVRLSGYLLEARADDAGPKQSANCAAATPDDRDMILTLGTERDASLCAGVTAWVSPHFRPDAWDALAGSHGIASLRGHPIRVTGPLLFDAGHGLCFRNAATRGNPPRVSTWEIHPVYNIEVCSETALERCPAGQDGLWQPLAAVASTSGSSTHSPLPPLVPFTGAAVTAAAAPPAAAVPVADSAALLQLEQEWTAALAAGDAPMLNRLLADDYAGTDGAGRRQVKAGLIAAVRIAAPAPPGVIDEAEVRFIADGVAVVSGRLTQSIPLRGESIAIQSRFTDTFVKRSGLWILAASHISRTPVQ